MKILYHHRTLADGAEGIHIQEMVNAFRETGHEVRLVGPAVGSKKKNNLNTNSLMTSLKKFIHGPAYELMEICYNLFGYMALEKAVKEFKPDLIYDRYITFNYSSIAIGRKYHIPVFLEVNSPLAYERDHESDEKLYFKKLAYMLEKRICNDSFKTIVVSTPLKYYLTSIGIDERNIIVMPNGVNENKFYPRHKSEQILMKLGISDRETVIGFSGILRPWHGIDVLLHAFKKVHKQLPDTILLLVGDGPIRKEIEEMAEEMNISGALKITGRVRHEDVADYVSVFDIAVSPKATFYASPMKIPEYMAQKKAVVAPDTGNIRDLITDRVNGLLFKDGSVDSLAASIIKLSTDDMIKEQLANEAYHETQRRLSWKRNALAVTETQPEYC